jgi:hypothetical protein
MTKKECQAMKRKQQTDPWGFLLKALELKNAQLAMTNQVKLGQEQMVQQKTLPVQMQPESAKQWLAKCGVKFLGQVENDELFQSVELPPGWKKIASGHPWLSMLVDDQGRERARIFYKAEYYDRNASLSIQPRYGVLEDLNHEVPKGSDSIAATVMDGSSVLGTGEILFMTKPIGGVEGRKERFRAYYQAKKEAYTWLDQNFPENNDPFAYWE